MKLVLCDDHLMWLEALEQNLAARGHVVAALATTPDQALDAVATNDPDVVALDVSFPDGSGLQVASRIRDQCPRSRVVMLTGSSEPSLVSAAVDAGAAGFTRKDQSVDAIVAALERVAEGGDGFGESQQQGLDAGRRLRAETETAQLLRYLTPQERHVLRRLVDGRSTSEIARELSVTKNTARTHVQKVLMKLGAHSRLQAATMVVRAGLVDQL